MTGFIEKKESAFPFYLIILYLFLEYIRPQIILPPLRQLHLPAITVVLIAIILFISGKLSIRDKQTVVFMLFMSEMIVHGPFAVNNYWAFQRFYEMAVTFIAYLGIINIIDDDEKYRKLIKFWLIIFIFLAIIGILNKGVGVGGFIGDENDFCMAINMTLPFALFGIFSANSKTNKIYYLLITCLFLASILTYSRGGFVGLVSVMVYCWLRSNKKVALGVVMGLLVIFALIAAPSSYWDRVRSISSEYKDITETGRQYGTGGQRIYAWKIGWRIFINNPIVGVGQGNYPWHVGKTEDEMGVQWQTRSLAGRAAHSLYFTLLPELGLIGTFLFASMIVLSLKDLFYIRKVLKSQKEKYSGEESKRIHFLALALEGSLVGFLASSAFISTLYYPNFWILCGFIVSLRKIIRERFGDVDMKKATYAGSY
jgi:O-antigen ligase